MSALAQGTRFSFVCEANSDVRLDSLVATHGGLSRTQAATLIANGHVTLGGRREKASYKPVAGESVDVFVPPPAPREILGEAIPLVVVYEDDDLVVIDKPAGMVVHPAPGNWTGTLVNALVGRGGELSEAGGDERPGLVHRLDKDTSGLLLVAKHDRVHRLLSSAIAERRVVRRPFAGWRASTRGTSCAPTCTRGARTRFACTSPRSATPSWATTRTVAAAGDRSSGSRPSATSCMPRGCASCTR